MITMDKRIKERRESFLRKLRNDSEERFSTIQNTSPIYRSFTEEDRSELPSGKWVWQIPISVLLLIGIFLTYQSDHEYAKVGQAWVYESLTREFNFAGVEQWYNEKFAGSPSVLPKLKWTSDNSAPATATLQMKVIAPVRGQVMIQFQGKGIPIQMTETQQQVVAMSEGWVTSVEEMGDLGLTVVIRHPGGRETMYSWLDTVLVRTNDVVQGGDPIATVSSHRDSEEGLLYFSIKDNGEFIDPIGVVQFEN
jgi:stage IV sporulation protein FA